MSELESPEVEKEIGKIIKKRKNGRMIVLKLREIKPYPKNAKIHTEKQVAKIRDSIINFGYTTKIEIEENNIILAGHGRLRALYQIDTTGMKEVEVMQYSDYTESEKKAYRLAHNKLNLETGFDDDLLREELTSIEVDGFDLSSTGFTDLEINKVRDKITVSEHDRNYHDGAKTEHNLCPKCGFKLEDKNDFD